MGWWRLGLLMREDERREERSEKQGAGGGGRVRHKLSSTHKAMSANAPKRGKFLSQPQPSPNESTTNPPPSNNSAAPRGKTLAKSLTSTSSANTLTGPGPAAEADNSLSNLKHIVHEAKEAASARRKELSAKRDKVFDDLDQAENIIVSLLDCASDLAQSLSDMTTAKANGNNNSFEKLAGRIKENGSGYLAGVKKVHSLLAQHASLVKSYRTEDSDRKGEDDTNNKDKTEAEQIVKIATSNMYASRVEKRLALERSAILKEMIRLEELESSSSTVAGDCDGESTATGAKRKHEHVS